MSNHHPPDPLEIVLAEWGADEVKPESIEAPSAVFLQRARQAAQRGRSIRSLRAGVAKLGFQPRALPDYLAAAAASVEVNLAGLLAPSVRDGWAAAPWVRLAAKVGLEMERIKLHIRLWVAERQGAMPTTGFARGGSRSSDPVRPRAIAGTNPSKIADLLAVREESYDPATRAELAACLREVDEIL